jgi:hypothetical protein
MKNRKLKFSFVMLLVLTASCNDPETVVTNIIHPDGSVTRRIEMKSLENKFRGSDIQVPFDGTWTVRDSVELLDGKDTILVKRAEKWFATADEINRDYASDSSANKFLSRRVSFTKKFRWFHTDYRFEEVIEKSMKNGYPASDFLNPEELVWFYSPENVRDLSLSGPDSLKFKALNDSVDKSKELWTVKSIVSEWIGEFTSFPEVREAGGLSFEALKTKENDFFEIIMNNEDDFDSLWTNGLLLKEFIGEANALKFKEAADSSLSLVTEKILASFSDYTVKNIMPGRVTATNGFIDSTSTLLWPVISDYFLTEPYIMWTESKVPNRWAWIVSGLFVLFVFTGIILTRKKEG